MRIRIPLDKWFICFVMFMGYHLFTSDLFLSQFRICSSLQVLVPMLEWEVEAFSTPELGLLLFISLAIFPALLLPSAPSMWIAGMAFGYGYGFLLIMAATSLGMSLPYFIGSLFHHKIHVGTLCWVLFIVSCFQNNE